MAWRPDRFTVIGVTACAAAAALVASNAMTGHPGIAWAAAALLAVPLLAVAGVTILARDWWKVRSRGAEFGEFTEEMHAAGGFNHLPADRRQYWVERLQLHPDDRALWWANAEEFDRLRDDGERG